MVAEEVVPSREKTARNRTESPDPLRLRCMRVLMGVGARLDAYPAVVLSVTEKGGYPVVPAASMRFADSSSEMAGAAAGTVG